MKEFQALSFHHAFYPDKGHNLPYTMLGLCEEAGEAAGKVKKMLRDNDGQMTDEIKDLIIKELGDTLWYIACAGVEIGVGLDEIAKANVDKLADRRARGTLQGSGDTR
jgi:NTP pyrophosphatase (non-canonical NTP hydrolase)